METPFNSLGYLMAGQTEPQPKAGVLIIPVMINSPRNCFTTKLTGIRMWPFVDWHPLTIYNQCSIPVVFNIPAWIVKAPLSRPYPTLLLILCLPSFSGLSHHILVFICPFPLIFIILSNHHSPPNNNYIINKTECQDIDKVEDNENTGLVTLNLTYEKTRHSETKLKPFSLVIRRDDLVFTKGGEQW